MSVDVRILSAPHKMPLHLGISVHLPEVNGVSEILVSQCQVAYARSTRDILDEIEYQTHKQIREMCEKLERDLIAGTSFPSGEELEAYVGTK